MPNVLAPNGCCRTTYIPMVYVVDTGCPVPAPYEPEGSWSKSVVGNWVEEGVVKVKDRVSGKISSHK